MGGVTSRYAKIHSLCAKTSTWAAVYRHQSTHLHTDLLKHPQRPAHRTYRAMNTSLQTDTQRNILAKVKVFISNLKTMYSQTKMALWLEWQIVPSFHFVFTRHQVPAILCWLIALGVQLSFPSVSNNHAFILYLKLFFNFAFIKSPIFPTQKSFLKFSANPPVSLYVCSM